MTVEVEKMALLNTLRDKGGSTHAVSFSEMLSKPKVGTIAMKNQAQVVERVLDELITDGLVRRVSNGYVLTD